MTFLKSNLYCIEYMKNPFIAARLFNPDRMSRGILIGLAIHQRKSKS